MHRHTCKGEMEQLKNGGSIIISTNTRYLNPAAQQSKKETWIAEALDSQ